MFNSKKMHPVHATGDGIANSCSGRKIDFLSPTPQMICLEDIIIGLANVCRWGGQIRERFSVAQHTLLVWYLAPEELKRVALMHDAAEAYLGDVIKPFKNILGEAFSVYENKFNWAIFQKYQLNIADLTSLKPYDKAATEIEYNYFRLGKLDFIQKFYEIGELFPDLKNPKDQLEALMRNEFMQIEVEAER